MGLLTYTPIEDDASAVASLWNSRFTPLYNLANGNLDAANLANSAVTEAKINDAAVTAAKIGTGAVLPSKMANTWVGATDTKASVPASEFTVFNKTITLDESAYIYAIWTASAKKNSNADAAFGIYVDDVQIPKFGGVDGFDPRALTTGYEYPFAISGITSSKVSGDVNIKVKVSANSAGSWDLIGGSIRIDALSDDANLDV